MILTCPECATRYFVEDQRLGGAGRTVRCAACGSAWRAQAEEPLELTNSSEEGAVARSGGEPLSFRPPETPSFGKASLADVSADELPKTFRAQAEQQRIKRKAATAGVVWGVMCAGFAGLIGAAYLFRVDVVKLYPRAAGAYAMAGVPVNPTGLIFEKVAAAASPDGLQAITVSAVVRNVEDRVSQAPPIRVSLLDKAGRKIATQITILPRTSIAPGQSQAFSITLPDPRGATADVGLNFALDLMTRPARKPAPPRAAILAATPQPARLRPAMGVDVVTAPEATPVSESVPGALDRPAPKAVSAAGHG